jgi:hypothetical protein
MIYLLCLAFFALLWAAVATTIAIFLRHAHKVELAAVNKVGRWYEGRVEELENETRALAGQIVAIGGVTPHHAMPLPEADPGYEYASDATGLVLERLDPRDLLVG